jgi:osmotically-inducible protein OsmY
MRVLSVVLVLSLLAAACAPLVAQTKITDDQIYDEVRRKLAADTVVKGGAMGVEVKEGVVRLSGKVKTEKQKTRAESLTKKVKGVTKVVNELVVEI